MKVKTLLNLAIVVGIMFMSNSCADEQAPMIENGSNCYLIKLDASSNYRTYAYDNSNNLQKITLFDTLNKQLFAYKLYYNAPNNNLSRIDFLNGTSEILQEYRALNYNSDGKVASTDYYFDTTNAGGTLVKGTSVSYVYNSLNQIITENLYHWQGGVQQLKTYYKFIYDSKGNNNEVDGFTALDSALLTYKYTFDSKNNPSQKSKYNQYLEAGSIANKNNPLTYQESDALGITNYTYTYVYNSQDMPTRVTTTQGSGKSTSNSFSYNCK